jgi:flagellar basal-body rod protein FlgC
MTVVGPVGGGTANPLGTAASGIRAGIAELTAIAGNVANADDESAPAAPGYRPITVLPAAALGGGVVAIPVPAGNPSGVLVQQPASPLADAAGTVRLPDVDLVGQMTGLVVASGTVALNIAALRRALKAYQAVLDPDAALRRVGDPGEADQIDA